MARQHSKLFPEKMDCPPAAKVKPVDCAPARVMPKVHSRAYRLGKKQQEYAEKQIEYFLANGMYVRSEAAESSQFMVAPKLGGQMRLCNDLRRKNLEYDLVRTQLPTMPEIMEKMAGAQYWSSCNLCAAFTQLPISKRLSEAFTMSTASSWFGTADKTHLRMDFEPRILQQHRVGNIGWSSRSCGFL
jgi:hypothetical protein